MKVIEREVGDTIIRTTLLFDWTIGIMLSQEIIRGELIKKQYIELTVDEAQTLIPELLESIKQSAYIDGEYNASMVN